MSKTAQKLFVVVIVAFGIASSAQSQEAGALATRTTAAINVLEERAEASNQEEVARAINSLRSSFRTEACPDDAERLLDIAEDPTMHRSVRAAAMRVCVEQCNEQVAVAVAHRLVDWTAHCADVEALARDPGRKSEVGTLFDLLNETVSSDQSHRGLVLIASSGVDGRRFLEWLLSSRAAHHLSTNPGFVVLDRAGLTAEVKESLALGHVAAGFSVVGAESVSAYLSQDAEPTLIEMVRKSATRYDDLNHVAVSVLAHRGSIEVREILAAERTALVSTRLENMSDQEYIRYRSAIERRIDYWLRMISVQQKNESLLAFIASDTFDPDATSLRAWAVGRALERGIDKASIRQSVMEHLSHALAAQRSADDELAFRLRVSESEFRNAVLQSGLMTEEEWPSPFRTSGAQLDK